MRLKCLSSSPALAIRDHADEGVDDRVGGHVGDGLRKEKFNLNLY